MRCCLRSCRGQHRVRRATPRRACRPMHARERAVVNNKTTRGALNQRERPARSLRDTRPCDDFITRSRVLVAPSACTRFARRRNGIFADAGERSIVDSSRPRDIIIRTRRLTDNALARARECDSSQLHLVTPVRRRASERTLLSGIISFPNHYRRRALVPLSGMERRSVTRFPRL